MRPSNKSPNPPSDVSALEKECIVHLEQETLSLSAILESLRIVDAALRRGDQETLLAATQRQIQAYQSLQDCRQLRAAFRSQCADILSTTPQRITLTYLASVFSTEVGDTLRCFQARIRDLAAEVQARSRDIRVRTTRCLDLMRRWWGETAEALDGRYGPTGTQIAPRPHRLLEAQG